MIWRIIGKLLCNMELQMIKIYISAHFHLNVQLEIKFTSDINKLIESSIICEEVCISYSI